MEEFELGNDLTEEQLPSQAFVRAMRGCNKFCTYCVVPYVRGPEASRPPKVIIEQIKTLSAQGVKLITLLGQTVNSYNYTESGKTYRLADLLQMASEIDGIEWIRFITSYPGRFRRVDISCDGRTAQSLPLSAYPRPERLRQDSKGDESKLYRRRSISNFWQRHGKSCRISPSRAILLSASPARRTRILRQTIDLLRKAEYKNSFIFKYSPRPGTHADKKLEDNISAEIKKQRNMRLLGSTE